ncbi:hypothetical protein ACFOG5_15425 [Pedobacter fastidiosus]|uniref:Uncharacterized protein n=1 Tax=Pedobacter fastidiosus TaxID=2765361 RepID=A0ABR7KQC5_9SPHI|nr:hypothetical protein [Pedobacter fastidiosus]MBC6110284.1 hypothetical protein [Pedobacter fastidiosus]
MATFIEMLKHYKYPLKVWASVLTGSMPLFYLLKYIFSNTPLEDFLFELTYLNVLIGYLGSLLVCIPFWLIFWVIYVRLIKSETQKIKLYLFLISQVIWWLPFYLICYVFKIFSSDDFLLTFSPHAVILAVAVVSFRTEKA